DGVRSGRRRPGTPAFPPATLAGQGARTALTLLHLPDLRLGRQPVESPEPSDVAELQDRICGEVERLSGEGAGRPELILVTGDLTESGGRRQFAEATNFLLGLRVLLGLEPHRLVVVPGGRDISGPACEAYFADCAAEEVEPQLPYWPKWRHYVRLFE